MAEKDCATGHECGYYGTKWPGKCGKKAVRLSQCDDYTTAPKISCAKNTGTDKVMNINEFNNIDKDGMPEVSGNYLVISNDNNIFVAYLNTVGDWTATGGKHYGDLHKEHRIVTHYMPGRLIVEV